MARYMDGKQASEPGAGRAPQATGPSPGKHTLVEQINVPPVQQRAKGPSDEAAVHEAAGRGVATPSSAMPHGDAIQRAFGSHDISGVQAHTGPEVAAAAGGMNAEAYATGNHVVLGNSTDLFTAAHEAAHVVQQRGGVQLKSGVGEAGDAYERHADEVASLVVQGKSAEQALDRHAGSPAGAPRAAHDAPMGAIQRKTTIVDDPEDPTNKTKPGTGTGLLKNSKGKVLPKKDNVFGPLREDCATFMEAWFDTNDFDAEGTEPRGGTWPSWWDAAKPKAPSNPHWVRGHLLNHNLGGPGEKRNLTPITKKANNEHKLNVENFIKAASDAGGSLVGYQVTATYSATGPSGLKGDDNDPDKSVWPKLTTGFDCIYYIITDVGDEVPVSRRVENSR